MWSFYQPFWVISWFFFLNLWHCNVAMDNGPFTSMIYIPSNILEANLKNIPYLTGLLNDIKRYFSAYKRAASNFRLKISPLAHWYPIDIPLAHPILISHWYRGLTCSVLPSRQWSVCTTWLQRWMPGSPGWEKWEKPTKRGIYLDLLWDLLIFDGIYLDLLWELVIFDEFLVLLAVDNI